MKPTHSARWTTGLTIAAAIALFVFAPSDALAGSEQVTVETHTVFDELGPGGLVISLFAVPCFLCGIFGLRAARRPDKWPHWAGLVRGLGSAAFLLGILVGLPRLYWTVHLISSKNAAVEPNVFAEPLRVSLGIVMLGASVSLIALVLSGLIRLREGKPQAA